MSKNIKEVAKNSRESSSNLMASIPAKSRKLVKRIKEIVNYNEIEIFNTLQECNMDPDEAINRLLNQDSFQEVKSKREKKKGKKDSRDDRAWNANNFPKRGVHNGAEHFANCAVSSSIPYGSRPPHCRLVYRKKNESEATLSSAHGHAGNDTHQNSPTYSEYLTAVKKVPATGISGSGLSVQSAWPGASGQVTTADIIKMGRPQGKDAGMLIEEDFSVRYHYADHCGSTTGTTGDNNNGEPSQFDNINSRQRGASYSSHKHFLEHSKAEEIATSLAEDLWQLNLKTFFKEEASEEGKPSVVIPDHLQVQIPEGLQLRFGSFSSTVDAFGPDFAPLKHAGTINTRKYGEEDRRAQSVETLLYESGQNAKIYDSNFVPHAQLLIQDTSEPVDGNQYEFSSSLSGCNYGKYQQLNDALFQLQQPYSSSLPNTLLPSSVQSVVEHDFSYSPLAPTQSTPTMYNDLGSISGSSILMAEALRGARPAQQTAPGANIPAEPAFPEPLSSHIYPQTTLPMGHYTDMIDHPYLPQSNTFMPSAIKQAYAGNTMYNRSLAAELPQYKHSISAGSLPQSGAVASGYGFGSSASIPGQNFPASPPSALMGTTTDFNDVYSSQFKKSNRTRPFQQNENSAMWIHGPGSGTKSAVPANTYSGFLGQSQQHSEFQQSQQPSRQFAALGNPELYQSQGLISPEQQQLSWQFAALGYPDLYQSQGVISPGQQQHPREKSLHDSPGQVLEAQQIWKNYH